MPGYHQVDEARWEDAQIETAYLKKGQFLLFDYRLPHRGLGNSTNERHILYYETFSAVWDGTTPLFTDELNYSKQTPSVRNVPRRVSRSGLGREG